jgi:tryptophan-rich hypothetical protein
MNRIHPGKLLNSKWTAAHPERREKHFVVVEVEFDEKGIVIECQLEAVISRRRYMVNWRVLTDAGQWIQGWK